MSWQRDGKRSADARSKSSLPVALAAYPGEECIAFVDSNAVPACPGLTLSGGWTHALATGFPMWPDPIDPRRDLRSDGLRTKDMVNFLSPGQCTPTGCPSVPPSVPLNIPFNQPTTEFGFMFRASWEGVNTPLFSGLKLVVNGVDLRRDCGLLPLLVPRGAICPGSASALFILGPALPVGTPSRRATSS